jgi:hypothetical protein
MNQRLFPFAVAAALSLATAWAVETRTWSQNEQADYEKAILKGVSLRSDGRLALAPAVTELFDAATPYLWAIARDSKGTLYAAGGGTGGSTVKIFRAGADRKGTPWAELEGLEIHALAIDKQDRVYAATLPDGKVWRIGADAKPTVFYDPKARYIWALAFNGQGDLFVATGDQGEIHRVRPDGQGTVFFKLDEAHARAMAFDTKGNLVVGTEPGGVILRVAPNGTGFVLYQTAKREVTALVAATDGRVIAAAVGNKGALSAPMVLALQPAPPPPPGPAAGQAPRPAAPAPLPLGPPAAQVQGGSDVIELDADGAPRKLWSHPQEVVYALALDAQGKVILGAGNKGNIYRLDSAVLSTLLTATPATQVTGFAGGSDGLFATTGNVGKVFAIGPGLEKQGTVESDVFDAGTFSYWGRLNDDVSLGSGTIRFETRSGNLDRPQKNWSAWAPLKDGRLTSPPARFLQWKATFSPGPSAGGAAPELGGVDIAWMAKNLAPRVEQVEATPANYRFPQNSITLNLTPSITLAPLGKTRRSSAPSLSLDTGSSSSMSYAKGTGGARWLAADDNGDALNFKVEIKGVAESTWKLIKDRVREKQVNFDLTAYPDGEYFIRVTANDQPDNPPAQALEAAAQSPSFLIDNTPPVIEDLAAQPAGGRVQLRFKAKDALNWISKAEYSINGVEWLTIEPATKLSDSRELAYDLLLDRPQPGELTIAVRVTDEFDNQATAKIVVR